MEGEWVAGCGLWGELGRKGSWLVVSPGCPPVVEPRAREGGQEC